MCAFGKRETYFSSDRLTAQRHSSNTVLFTWFWGIAVGAMPFFLSGQLRVVQSLFESVSGWTTTGLSVMDVTQTSKIFLFYRSFMQYCGGLGFVAVNADGSKTVTYRGTNRGAYLCLGDLQNCVIRILEGLMNSAAMDDLIKCI